ncbi:hypothetical protein M8J77_006878 [Diaphorina citri]|nr:hypothetical protein M8J77_006878 [Diaphorina citri]
MLREVNDGVEDVTRGQNDVDIINDDQVDVKDGTGNVEGGKVNHRTPVERHSKFPSVVFIVEAETRGKEVTRENRGTRITKQHPESEDSEEVSKHNVDVKEEEEEEEKEKKEE